jgi:hypothetical protein
VTDRLLPAGLVALLLVFLQWRSGVDSPVLIAVVSAAFAYVTFAAGRLLAAPAAVRDGDPSSVWVLGILAICLATYALTLLLPVTAGGAFGVVAAIVIGAEFALRRKSFPQADRKALIGFALAVVLTAAWCNEPAGAYEVVRSQGVLPLWSDYFFQGSLISQFGDMRALGRGSIYLADNPSSFYHFASYGAAAAFARLLDQPGLPLAAAVWLPLGFLAMLAGAYALGARLAGPAGGIAALAAIALLPDASNYGLRNGWFSFHWTLLAHAGATYAVGAAFLSLALLERWASERSRAALTAGALVVLSAFFFRFHIFILLLPAWLATAIVCSVERSRVRVGWLVVVVLAAGAAAANLAVSRLADAGFWRLGNPSAFYDFLWYVHTGHEPTAYTGVYEKMTGIGEPIALALVAGIGFAIAAALGAFVLALPAAALVARRAGVLRPIDAACGYLFFCWLLLMFFAPTPWHGDPSDLIHRPFVLLYAACAIWTLCFLVRIAGKNLWAVLLAGAILALPAIFATAGQMAKPKFRWSEFDAAVRVPPGLVEAAEHMRQHAAAGDVFAVAGLSAAYATFDLSTQVCALSGMPAYLSRPHFEMIKDARRKQVVMARLAALQEIESLTDPAAAMQALRALKVRWYLISGDQAPRWDPERARAAFRAGTVALYRIP